MTVLQALVALLLVALLVYALMYVGWLPRPRGSISSAGTFAGKGDPESPDVSVAHYSGEGHDAVGQHGGAIDAGPGDAGLRDAQLRADRESSRALTLAWVDGTYLSTSVAISRQERVGAAGMNVQAKANMVVDDSSVRWEREGLGEVRVAGSRLLAVSSRRSLADMLMGHAEIVLVSWRAGNSSTVDPNVVKVDLKSDNPDEQQGDLYVTAFLPRSRTDSAALVSAVQRLMKMDGTP